MSMFVFYRMLNFWMLMCLLFGIDRAEFVGEHDQTGSELLSQLRSEDKELTYRDIWCVQKSVFKKLRR